LSNLGVHSRECRRARAGLRLFSILWFGLWTHGAAAVVAIADDFPEVRVRYRSADSVYLDAGEAVGLTSGERLAISRDGKVVAEVEVTFLARHSASCRVLTMSDEIRAGDLVLRLGPAPAPTLESQSEAVSEPPGSSDYVSPSGAAGSSSKLPNASRDSDRYDSARRPTRLSGTLIVDWESLSGSGGTDLGYTRTGARLDLRVRDIGGHPYDFRARMRSRRYDRDRLLADLPSQTETRDRFYELALTYAPPEGRFSFAAGRLGAGAAVFGYLDGVVGRMALGPSLTLGALVGSRPDLEEFSFGAAELKYGLFAEYSPVRRDETQAWSILFAGVREEGEADVSREFLSLRMRYDGGGRWSLFQRAELDLNNGWRREFESEAVQLSSFSIGAMARLSDATRLTVSYDRYERYRTEDTRFLARELFDDLLRYGFRARLSHGRPRSLNVSIFAGIRDRDDDVDATVSFGGGVSDSQITRWNLHAYANLLAFSNPFTEGWVATLRAGKRFRAGHEIDLTLGERLSTDLLFDENLSTGWFRLGGWIELPKNLFANLGYEVTTGDEVDDQLASASLGYRF